MNSSQIAKRTLPLIFVLVLIIGIAISCTVFNKDKVIPTINDEEGVYLSISEGGRTYSIANKKMYDELKSAVGLNVLIDKIDTDLLKNTAKGDSNYWDAVTNEEIEEEIEKAIFPNGRDGLAAEDITKAEEQYVKNMFTSLGYKTQAEINNYHRLTLAKKLYASDQLTIAIELGESANLKITEENYETYYKANYLSGYWTVIVPFNTRIEGENLLKQIGIKVVPSDVANQLAKWVYIDTDEELTPNQIAKAYIDMYNTVNSHKLVNYPVNTLTLTQGTQYTNEEGKITFNKIISEEHEDMNKLYYSYSDIIKFQSEIQNFLKVSMTNYNPEATTLPTSKSWFTPSLQAYSNNNLFVYILKIGEQSPPTQASVQGEIYEALFKAKLTTNYISTEIVKLRQSAGVTIFDPEIETAYIANAKSYGVEHKTTKETSKTIIAKVGEVEYSADALFALMDQRYGMALATSEINYQRLLSNPLYNMIYDYYNIDGSIREKVLDKDKWSKVREAATLEKQIFASNMYAQYGFPASYGWKNFMRDFYNVSNAEELLFYFLYTDIMSEFAVSLGDVTDADATSEMWKLYEGKMQEMNEGYFNVTGVHLLITVFDDNGNPKKPEEWTDLQKQYAEELYRDIWAYYSAETGTSSQKLQAINDLFKSAPRFLATKDQTVEAQPEIEGLKYVIEDENNYSIEVSKFKSAGLSVKFEDLGNFQNGAMVEEFDAAVKSIYDRNPSTTSHTPYGYNPGSDVYDYLITQFGYHAYVNTSTIDIPKWYYNTDTDKTTPYVFPTLQMVKTYLADSDSKFLLDEEGNVTSIDFTADMKKAVLQYFVPIQDEIVGSYYTSIELFGQMKNLNITFNSGNYTRDNFNNFIDLRIESYYSNLKYFTVEE